MRKTSSASKRRTQNRSTRNRLTPRRVLSDDTLRMGSHVKGVPTAEQLSYLRQRAQKAGENLFITKRRVAQLTAERANTSRARFLKRLILSDDIAQEKSWAQAHKSDWHAFQKEHKKAESQLKKTHRAKLERMRRSRGPNLP